MSDIVEVMNEAAIKGAVLQAITDARAEGGIIESEWTGELEELWEQRCYADSIISGARAVREEIDDAIAQRLNGASARLDDYLVKSRPTRTLRADRQALVDWITDYDIKPKDVLEMFNPNSLRATSYRSVAEKYGRSAKFVDSETGEIVDAVTWEEGEERLKLVPLIKAPKYTAAMKHGELRQPRRPAA